ncbi:hypothetical protein BDV96DRAFT_583722 [Lophiotrema nucula]|uniref:Cora-like Mg2+ transporter protein-domain-containing protein n=1 Tax=Lophiotrema nucula TaxID=690887 RepID=A0A6A5YV77_9PLEO|nr:hypothetical protein BDV96DRAFT_583722 [Lophiotrema nucula]
MLTNGIDEVYHPRPEPVRYQTNQTIEWYKSTFNLPEGDKIGPPESETFEHASSTRRKRGAGSSQIPSSRRVQWDHKRSAKLERSLHEDRPEKSNRTQDARKPNTSQNTRDERRTPSPENDQGKRISDIHVPPFLTWVITKSRFYAFESGSDYDSDDLGSILDAIHDALSRQLPVPNRKRYRRAAEITYLELRDTLNSRSTAQSRPPVAEGDNEPQVSGIEWLSLNFDCVDGDDRIHISLLKACNQAFDILFHDCRDLLSYYMPDTTDYMIARKCWGAFDSMVSCIREGLLKDGEAKTGEGSTFWVTRDISGSQSEGSLAAALSWSECGLCLTGHVYRKYDEALHHVTNVHYKLHKAKSKAKANHTSSDIFAQWLRNDTQYRIDQRLELCIQYLHIATGHLRTALVKAKHIREGVALPSGGSGEDYLLPPSLITALERVIMLLIHTSRAFVVINRYCGRFEEHCASKESQEADYASLTETRDELTAAGEATSRWLDKAHEDVMLVAHTDSDVQVVSYEAVGVEYILASLMGNLYNKPVCTSGQVHEVYSVLTRKLQFDALRHPRSKIIRDIWHMQKELAIILEVTRDQWICLDNFLGLLDWTLFPISPERDLIRAHYFNREYAYLRDEMDKNYAIRIKIRSTESQLNDINEHVLQMLQIRQESNSNAIIVFTLVTIIFLPLSWATSYLGMNTADLRSMQQGQWVFWTMAIPITSIVIALAMVVIFKGETLRESFIQRRTTAPSKHVEIKKLSRSGSTFASHEEMEQSRWTGVRRRWRKHRTEEKV